MTLPRESKKEKKLEKAATRGKIGKSGKVTKKPPAIKVDDVSLTYRVVMDKRPPLKEAIKHPSKFRREVREIDALKGVSFELEEKHVLGIVGNNGAGKSTLVRTIAGILPPTEGQVTINGRVSTLLSLGVGFNKKLTGHENVILGGLASGYTRDEIEEKFHEIADWTELGDRLEMQVSTYSSGMYSRLAFAVAVHMDPDIMIVDEALSTGDARFKAKAVAKMKSLLEGDRTMVLVSHSLATVQEMCTDAIWLDQGQLLMRGTPDEIIEAYTEANSVDRSSSTAQEDL